MIRPGLADGVHRLLGRNLPIAYCEIREQAMNLKDKAKGTIDTAAAAAKRTSEKIIDKSKDAAHSAGKSIVKQGKRLQNV